MYYLTHAIENQPTTVMAAGLALQRSLYGDFVEVKIVNNGKCVSLIVA